MNLKRYVVGFPYDRNRNEVVLIRKTHPPEQAGLLNGMGGRIEIGESPVQAMVREAAEEANLVTTKDDWLQFHYERHSSGTCLYFYVCELREEQRLQIHSMTEEAVVAYPPHVIPRRSLYNLHWLIPMGLCYLNHPQHRYLEG